MKIVSLLFLGVLALHVPQARKTYSVTVHLSACEHDIGYYDKVFLLKNGLIIDSLFRESSYYILGIIISDNKLKYRFDGLTPGEYQVRYSPMFKFDSIIPVSVVDRNQHVEVCFDRIPATEFDSAEALDQLTVDDTLFLNAYIASAGEFGGYDEGLWIWRQEKRLIGQFYSLSNSYAYSGNRELFYRASKSVSKPISDTINLDTKQLHAVRKFIVQTKNYRRDRILSNAPEYIAGFNGQCRYQIEMHTHSRWMPYSDLKEAFFPTSKEKTLDDGIY